jgi:uncharacterized membrane protein
MQVIRHRASVAMPASADQLFGWLKDVGHWPEFLEGLDGVEEIGFRRYRCAVSYAGHSRSCDVVVSIDPRDRRVAWKHLHGPAFDGTLRLRPLTADRTRVDLLIDIAPVGLLDGFVESTGMTDAMAARDLQRLRRLVLDGAVTGRPVSAAEEEASAEAAEQAEAQQAAGRPDEAVG